MAEHNELGKWGEDEAARFLQRKGFSILERDWRVGKRDLDIIALKEDGKLLVFVEVKTRRNDVYLQPEEAVNTTKMRNIAIAANAYVKQNMIDCEIRFDIISVIGMRPHVESIDWIEDACNPLLL